MKFGFIIGTGRCGTSMLAQMLNAHSAICVPHEIQILFEYSGNGKRFNEIFESGEYLHYTAEDFIRLVEMRCPHKFDEYFDYPAFFRRLSYPLPGFDWMINRLYAEIAASRGKSFFFEQTPWYGQRIDVLNRLFPDAKYIHMVRDGRDVAISFARTPWWHKDIESNLVRWNSEINRIRQSCEQMLRPDQVLQLRYEDVVAAPEDAMKEVCRFLALPVESAMLDPAAYIDYRKYSWHDSSQISSSALNEWVQSRQGSTFGDSVYSWKRYAKHDFSAMPAKAAQTLRSLGYEVDATARTRSGWFGRLMLGDRLSGLFRRQGG